ncbi:MAG: GAF domain-containing protein [Microcoleaceae cyanobacterium]
MGQLQTNAAGVASPTGMTLGQLLQRIQEEENADVLLEVTVAYLHQRLNMPLIWIGLYDRLTHQLIGKGGVTPTGEQEFLFQKFQLPGGSYLEQVVIQQCLVEITDLQTDRWVGQWRKIGQAFNIQQVGLFPLQYRDQCYGVVLLGSTLAKRLLKPKDRERLTIIFRALATALHHIESDWQHHRNNHPNQLILRLVSQFLPAATEVHSFFDSYLEHVAEAAQQFLEPSRTSVYWYQPEGHFFWRRIGNSRKIPELPSNRPSSGLILQDLEEFYQGLITDKLVSIGEAQSSLTLETTECLLEKLRIRSILAAPIQSHQGLLGFIAVESQQPRIWQTAEKTFLQDIAQLLGITAPLSELDTSLQQTEQDCAFMTQVAQLILAANQGEIVVPKIVNALCQHLHVARCLLLKATFNHPRRLHVLYQHQPANRRLVTHALPVPTHSEDQRLQRSRVIALETWDERKPFQAWRQPLESLGIRSLLVCRMESEPYTLLVVGHEIARSWTQREQELIKMVSQHLGISLKQQQDHQRNLLHQKLTDAIAASWEFWQQTQQIDELEWHFIQQLAQVLHSPWVALITGLDLNLQSRVVWFDRQEETFKSRPNLATLKADDPLIQRVINANGLIWISPQELTEQTRQWFNLPKLKQIILIPLKAQSNQPPVGAVIIANPGQDLADPISLKLMLEFVQQLAWQRQVSTSLNMAQAQHITLEQLNWYKQSRIKNLHCTLEKRLEDLQELEQLLFCATDPHQQQIAQLRYQQLLRQINQTLSSTSNLLEREQWQLHNSQDVIHTDKLLRQIRNRLQPLVKARQVLLQIHQKNRLDMIGDRFKLELVVYELLKLACERSQPTEIVRVDVVALNNQQFELKITHPGTVRLPSTLASTLPLTPVLQDQHFTAPSETEGISAQNLLRLCQGLIHWTGGQLHLQQLETGQFMSRLILPLLPGEP